MFPAVPVPENAGISIPVEMKLKPRWHYDTKRRVFVSDSGQTFRAQSQLPKNTKIVHKISGLAKADPAELSSPERDLQRHLQVILPRGESAAEYVTTIRTWPCVAEAHAGPEISLP